MNNTSMPVAADATANNTPVAISAEQLALECKRIEVLENVQQIKLTDTAIEVFTKILYCIDPRDDVVHEIGQFRIEIPLARGIIRWFNLDRQVNNFQAPHVSSDGGGCLGNMSLVLYGLLAAHEFSAAATIAIAFVESVNINDCWGRQINLWPVAKKKN